MVASSDLEVRSCESGLFTNNRCRQAIIGNAANSQVVVGDGGSKTQGKLLRSPYLVSFRL
jgi:hypothetical protein